MHTFIRSVRVIACTAAALLVCSFPTLFVPMLGAPQPPNAYTWDRVAVGGGGFATGILFHPRNGNILYARVDVAGPFRWDGPAKKWINLGDSLPTNSPYLRGCDGLAVDPGDQTAQVVYAVFGQYQDGHNYLIGDAEASTQGVYKSLDRGAHWTQILSVRAGSNENFRVDGEPLAVDPKAPQMLFVGTRRDGLFISANATSPPSQIKFTHTDPGDVSQVPSGHIDNGNHSGIRNIVFDPSNASGNTISIGGIWRTRHVYAGVAKMGVYASADGGQTWAEMRGAGEPSGAIHRMVVLSDGTLVVSHDGGLSKYSGGAWSVIGPGGAVALNPANPDEMTVLSGWPAAIYRTTNARTVTKDAGWTKADFKSSPPGAVSTATAPWAGWSALCYPDCVAYNPDNPKQLWESDVYGVWMTPDATATPMPWVSQPRGLEITVAQTLLSPPSGPAKLLAGFGDVRGFRWIDLSAFPTAWMTQPQGTAAYGFAGCFGDANAVVRWSSNSPWEGFTGGAYWYSADNGVHWTAGAIPNVPGQNSFGPVQLAVSSDPAQRDHVVMMPSRSPKNATPFYNDNGLGGKSAPASADWNLASGPFATDAEELGPGGTNALQADPKDGRKFYLAYTPLRYKTPAVYVSTDYGHSWTIPAGQAASGLPIKTYGWTSALGASPVEEGDLWLSVGDKGLYHSTDGAASFGKIANVSKACAMAVGKPRRAGDHCAVYVFGLVTDKTGVESWGVFLSEDAAKTWNKISPPSFQIPTAYGDITMIADGQVFGRVYIADGDTGVIYGQPVNTPKNL